MRSRESSGSEHLNQIYWKHLSGWAVPWIVGNSGNAFKYYNGTVTKLSSISIAIGLQSVIVVIPYFPPTLK
ncbi:MAG: hypothetical protein J7K87_02985 [Candidatus Aenigmarchaeota archaeon]|nr:hypothetical protein [Candidatus Aenigmarchaeota archaeon]